MKGSGWIKTAAIFQILSGLIHSVGLFIKPQPQDEQEKQMIEAMMRRVDAGMGMSTSQWDLFLALSSCFSFLCLFSGLLNLYLVRKNRDEAVMRGVININIITFGICFATMACLTFPPPIICTGLIFISLCIARFRQRSA